MTPGDLISQYNKIKATRLIIEAEHKAAVQPYKQAEEDIENALLDWLNANGLQNFKSPDGTAYKTTHVNTKLVDRQALIQHCVETNNFDIFTNSLTKEVVKQYVEDFKKTPPGVEVSNIIVVNVRKG